MKQRYFRNALNQKKSPCYLFIFIFFTFIGTISTYASCDSNESMSFEAFDGRVSQSDPTQYSDINGNIHTIIPNTLILHLYFSEKWAKEIYRFSEDHRKCYAIFYANGVFVAKKPITVAFMLDNWSKYIDQFIILVDKSKSSEESILDSVKTRPIELRIQIQQEM